MTLVSSHWRVLSHGPSSVLPAALGVGAIVAACASATPDDANMSTTTGSSTTSVTASTGSTVASESAGSTVAGSSDTTDADGAMGSISSASVGSLGSGNSGSDSSSVPTSGSAVGGASATGETAGGATGTTAGTGGVSAAGGASASSAAGGSGAMQGCDWTNPEDRIVLFDGTSLDQWKKLGTDEPAHWRLVDDGSMEVVPIEPPTNIQTRMSFEALCIHLEYMTPSYPASITGQDRGNSGVYVKSAYEMQVLDSVGQPAGIDTCGAVYGISAPLVVACHEQLVWNTYQIEFKPSVWDDNGNKIENAMFVNVTLNGELVQKDVVLDPPEGFTPAGVPDAPGPQPLMLQDHRNLVRFRNIWVKVPRD